MLVQPQSYYSILSKYLITSLKYGVLRLHTYLPITIPPPLQFRQLMCDIQLEPSDALWLTSDNANPRQRIVAGVADAPGSSRSSVSTCEAVVWATKPYQGECVCPYWMVILLPHARTHHFRTFSSANSWTVLKRSHKVRGWDWQDG